MIKILFNAFSFLREHLKKQNINYVDSMMEIPENYTPNLLIKKLGFKEDEVEAVFINRLIGSKDTILKDVDRVALLPPGTPGCYRLMLGIKKA